ncbi:MAG: S41 family peptidase [Marinifilaceae bacterium]|jgi:Tol biopolymer transport system component/C-terminal processing protease CtpA/Prc|nr:S41 family peptidase [Marinifilaceae bacterium]
MKTKLFLATLFCIIGMTTALYAQNNVFARFPDLNNDASKLAFSYQGDIWVYNFQTNISQRLTINDSYEYNPKWSDDDKYLSFVGSKYHNEDIYIIPAQGGKSKRLTFRSSYDYSQSWTKDNDIMFNTRRDYAQIEREPEVYSISSNGGTPSRLLDGLGYTPVESPNGRFIAIVRGTCRIEREAYDGPANRNIWIYDTKIKKYIQVTSYTGHDFNPEWKNDSTLLFISSRENKKYNIFSIQIDKDGNKKSNPIKLTNEIKGGIRNFSLSKNEKIAYEYANHIALLDLNTKQKTIVNLHINTDDRFVNEEYKNVKKAASEYSVSPNGKYTAMVVRGEIFVTANNTGSDKTIRITNSPFRERDVEWIDNETLIFTSDRDGQYEMYTAKFAEENRPNIMEALSFNIKRLTNTEEEEFSPTISPKGKKVVFTRGTGQLVLASIENGKLKNEKILIQNYSSPYQISWSPDGNWISFVMSDLDDNKDVYIKNINTNDAPVNISMFPLMDTNPVWSPDGSKLAFISIRNNGDSDIWFVWLKKSDWEKTSADWKEEATNKKEELSASKSINSSKSEAKSKLAKAMQIDLEDIHERVVQVTGLPGNEYSLKISKDGNKFYFVTNANSRRTYKAQRDLFSINWDGTKLKQITQKGQKPYLISLDNSGKYIYLSKRGGLNRLNTKNNNIESIPYNAHLSINHKKELMQIFEEAWRAIDVGFYDPNFHGIDWDKTKETYKRYALNASTREDFQDVVNFMLGQINASHMGLYRLSSRGTDENPKEKTGIIGAEVISLNQGVKVINVIEHSPADKIASKLNIGDIIISVNGQKIHNKMNYFSTFKNTIGEKVLLKVKGKNGKIREVIIRPKRSIRNDLYNAWVKERRRLTEKYSNGRLGYLHIKGMNWTSFEQFSRELAVCGKGKEGIVIDVRYNGGGWTTDHLMAVLDVKQHAYCVPRGASSNINNVNKFKSHYPFGSRLPFASWTKPSIAMCNANSYSNAEIFSHAYKTLGLGTLVGIPTFGAVISTSSRRLIDGSYVRLPFRGWFVKGSDLNMENGPAVPDVIIDNTPDYRTIKEDQQLKKSVELLLKQIDNK